LDVRALLSIFICGSAGGISSLFLLAFHRRKAHLLLSFALGLGTILFDGPARLIRDGYFRAINMV
jgi:hypothetical protein